MINPAGAVTGQRHVKRNGLLMNFDPIAAVYFATAGITNEAHKAAYNRHILRGRESGWLATLIAEYPMIGGTSAAHSYNALNPALYQATWVNSPTHNANGVTGNGTTSYGRLTGLYAAVPHLCGFTLNARTNPITATTHALIGYQGPANVPYYGIDRADFGGGATYNRACLGNVGVMAFDGPAAPARTGVLAANRSSSTSLIFTDEGVSFATNGNSDTAAAPAGELYILAANVNGAVQSFSTANLSHVAAHAAHTPAQALAYAVSIAQLQTDLGR